jgi:hyperosmotically inducible periplasmic protein
MRLAGYAAFAATAFALLLICAPVHASKTDDRIESSAKKSYIFKTFLKDDDIKIQAKDGAVTLTGLVSEESYKLLAEKTVAGLSGVKSVDNRLEIKGAPPSANSDAWIKEKVKLTLLFHRSVNAVKTDIDVKDGVVTLRGIATSLAQKELAAEYARDVDEVKDVRNEMTVSLADKKTPKIAVEPIDDASITAQVNMALLLHRSTSGLNTSVTTKDGVATVKGKADTAIIKDQVTKIVNDVHGVKSVNNQMTIK